MFSIIRTLKFIAPPKIVSLEAVMANKITRLDSRFVSLNDVPSAGDHTLIAKVPVTTHTDNAATVATMPTMATKE